MLVSRGLARLAVMLAAAGVFAATGCDQSTGTPGTTASGVRAVTVTPSSTQVQVGQTTRLTVLVAGDSTQGVTWRTANAAIATVDNTGLVLGVATGVTTISAVSTVDTTKRGAATVTVVAAP